MAHHRQRDRARSSPPRHARCRRCSSRWIFHVVCSRLASLLRSAARAFSPPRMLERCFLLMSSLRLPRLSPSSRLYSNFIVSRVFVAGDLAPYPSYSASSSCCKHKEEDCCNAASLSASHSCSFSFMLYSLKDHRSKPRI
ncbi:uncharacterized protein LOC127746534 [Arachis duranensis]|uniref:Uncharacterized protein LOC127746534 n=1 Tax=Arachis duranensis TaxID=130453 RepID=A0A9C6TGK9_ARADU|nr:uncharacterized protein LOC127746534 [Arachis duranensis]